MPGTSEERFTPALVETLREGYGLGNLRQDALAGMTVAIVALPLSMAIAIAAGGTPAMGLYTAIIGGFVISALGGSRYQIGGPAGAFIVLVAATIAQHGVGGMIVATMMAGVIMGAIGLLRLGSYIKFIPYPVTVGFSAGIAVIIFSSQIKDLLGLTLTEPEPAHILEKLPVLWESLPSANMVTIALAFTTVALIIGLKRFAPRLPNLLIAVVTTTVAAALLGLNTPTIESTFGAVPAGLPMPSLPHVDAALLIAVLPNAIAFALLGAIEALLSAVVADGMTGHRHNSNMELVAQGVANIAVGLFGGMVATGTIARTATNVRAGGHGPVAGMLHAVFILLFIVLAAPLVGFVPLASLAGVLAVVAWNMIERDAIVSLLRSSRADAAVLLVTLGLTVFRDLTEAIVVGVALGAVLFIHRMSKAAEVVEQRTLEPEDADDAPRPLDPEIVIYRIRGAFFFGATASVGAVLDRISDKYRGLLVDLSDVTLIDSTAAHLIEQLVHKAEKRGVDVMLTGTTHDLRVQLFAQGLKPPKVAYESSIPLGLSKMRHRLDQRQGAEAEQT
ncbi:SulP family inorganic anion transporter [Pararhodobacter sp.]|uniref:SulP family inorganic anion transporter n=1 Tax=Pararhodobacter sp. TaxID=2127056 RepID=UPI002FDE5EC9